MNFITLMRQLRMTQEVTNWRVVSLDSHVPPTEFYALLEADLRQRQTPELEISQQNFKECSMLSDRRVYLRLKRGQLMFDCCASPFGGDYFFSYWMLSLPRPFTLLHFLGLVLSLGLFPALLIQNFGLINGLTSFIIGLIAMSIITESGLFEVKREVAEFLQGLSILGIIRELFFRLPTYFERDTAAVFLTVIHEAYLKVLDGLTESHNVRKLTEEERRKPELVEFFKL